MTPVLTDTLGYYIFVNNSFLSNNNNNISFVDEIGSASKFFLTEAKALAEKYNGIVIKKIAI